MGAQQAGFISPDLSCNADNDKWIEVVCWARLHDAEAAAKAAESSEQCVPMFALIDIESMLFLQCRPSHEPHGPGRRTPERISTRAAGC